MSAGAPGMSARVGQGGLGNTDLYSLSAALRETPYVCLSICSCVSTKGPRPLSRTLRSHSGGARPADSPRAPRLRRGGRKTGAKANDCFVTQEEAGGCLSRTRCKGSWWLLALIEEGPVAPAEPLTWRLSRR